MRVKEAKEDKMREDNEEIGRMWGKGQEDEEMKNNNDVKAAFDLEEHDRQTSLTIINHQRLQGQQQAAEAAQVLARAERRQQMANGPGGPQGSNRV